MATHVYWRLNITAINTGASIDIAEIQYTDSLGGANKATNADGTATASSETTPATNAHDSTIATSWTAAVPTQQIQFQFNTAIDVLEYRIKAPNSINPSLLPKDWTLEYSDDGSSWTIADTRTGETGWFSRETRVFVLSAPDTPTPLAIIATGATPSIIQGHILTPIQGSILFTGVTPIFSGDLVKIGNIIVTGGVPMFGLNPTIKPTISKLNFICTVTGTPDITIPISSINGSINDANNHSMLIVCPDGFTYGGQISERIDEGFIITTVETYTDGTSAEVDSYTFNINTIASDNGANSFSFSIRGTSAITPDGLKSYIAEGTSIVSVNTSGKYRIRCDYNSNLRPGDQLVIDDDTSIVVGTIGYNISAVSMYMTVTQA